MNDEFKLSDAAIMRIVQIIQEGMMTFTDATDLLREMRLEPTDDGNLVLTQKYKELVKKSHDDLLEKAARLKKEQEEMLAFEGWATDDGKKVN